ncbi:EAL domain-containing protein [Thiohalobacter sp. IOR34]|uniref:putative bifunctional diguanylate cyclase/phosphodiesterase n=1 Tax=Thiohalobacter sp. IOR34 TaxID=3057176 RepID=UPI0025B171B5|nr:EAL domain-containing protein [Thiohalobacter sp. IOR34]WJW74569.1 EAL domain-containing protein [Thiohalobacter sp. IOR34]
MSEHRKNFGYVLQLGSADAEIIRRYHDFLSQGAARFAEVYYNYLFDNPAMADVLYALEQRGGNIGDLVRAHLNQLLGLLAPEPELSAFGAGERHGLHGIEPLWVMGGYRLYLDHLLKLVQDIPDIGDAERLALENTLVKRVFHDMGLMLQGYWEQRCSELREARETAQQAQRTIEQLLDNVPQILWSVDVRGNELLYASPAAQRLLGLAPACDAIPCLEETHEDDRESLQAAWQRALEGETSSARIRLTAGDDRPEGCYRACFHPARSRRQVVRIDCLLEDVTEQQQALVQLQQQATTDELTRLANRTLWYDRVNQAISRCRRDELHKVVLLLLDIDHFKMVNDTLGRAAGDELLRQVASRLQAALRDSDTLARLGGDEFAILMPAVGDAHTAGERVAKKVLECFREPYHFADEELFFTTAIGIAVYPEHGADADTLLNRAEIAMMRAKADEAGYQFYTQGSEEEGGSRPLHVSAQLRHALERNEFELHYQPKVDMHSRRLCGAEALLRWKHPRDGLVAPARFLDTAEQMGLMSPITNWVLVTALRQCNEWRQAGLELPVSINVSARSFRSPRLLERIQWALREAGVDGDCLEIEITEDTLMADLDHGIEVLQRLADLGIGVAVDDFGTGYSSLPSLKRLPIGTLKIDRSFLGGISHSENDAVIVRSIIDIGHNLGFRVMAEGVEDDGAWELLQVLGCDAAQGFHISGPLSRQHFTAWLNETSWELPQH